MATYLLVDNGSRQPQATLQLRKLAASLSELSGKNVHAVSLQHADAIDPAELGGVPANTFTTFIQHHLRQGETEFVVVPLFFGLSKAVTSFIPQQVEILREEFADFTLHVTDVVYPLPAGDDRLARIMRDHIKTASADFDPGAKVVLVDHGSPSPKITEVRQRVASTLNALPDLTVDEAVMERREGKQYDFNGQLLDEWLRGQAQQGISSVVIAMMFFLPGRHAGSCGDVETIANNVVDDYPQLEYRITPLIGEHSLLLEILNDRLHSTGMN